MEILDVVGEIPDKSVMKVFLNLYFLQVYKNK